jgi:hypothetical protein
LEFRLQAVDVGNIDRLKAELQTETSSRVKTNEATRDFYRLTFDGRRKRLGSIGPTKFELKTNGRQALEDLKKLIEHQE